MGILKNLFNGTSKNLSKSSIDWIPLTDPLQLDDMVETSNKRSIAIFKFSTRCGLSRMVLKGVERSYESSIKEPEWYFLDLIKHRDLSNEISERFKVRHESPQLLVIRNGEVVYHDSHSGINMDAVKKIAI